MLMILLIVLVLLALGGGGGYYGYRRWGTGGGIGNFRVGADRSGGGLCLRRTSTALKKPGGVRRRKLRPAGTR